MKKKHLLFFSSLLFLMFTQLSSLHAQIKWTTFDNMSSKKMNVVFITASKEITNSSTSDPSNPTTRYSTEWDGWTRRMQQGTFSDKKVAKYGNKKYNFLRLDAVERQTINFKGKDYRYDANDGPNGRHELSKLLMGDKMKVPMTVILDKNQEVLKRISGFLSSKDLEAILKYYEEGTSKKQTWDDFIKEKNIILQDQN